MGIYFPHSSCLKNLDGTHLNAPIWAPLGQLQACHCLDSTLSSRYLQLIQRLPADLRRPIFKHIHTIAAGPVHSSQYGSLCRFLDYPMIWKSVIWERKRQRVPRQTCRIGPHHSDRTVFSEVPKHSVYWKEEMIQVYKCQETDGADLCFIGL